jgi:hypothetical protein
LEFSVGWTWSKAIDFGQNAGAVPRTNGQFDPFQVRYDKGLSALNFPHRVVATAVWSPRLPGEDAERYATAERTIWRVADGWSIAGIFTEASGRGYSYDVFGGTRLAGGGESINGSGGSVVLPTVGRNTLRLPVRASVDLRLERGFELRKAVKLSGFAEAFNLLNERNLTRVEPRAFLLGTPVVTNGTSGPTPLVFQDAATIASEGLTTPAFGAATSSTSGVSRERQVEFGVRMEF